MSGYIDVVVNLFTPDEVNNQQTGFDAAFTSQVRMPDSMRGGVTIEDYLRKMDRAGIERSLLIAVRAGDLAMRGSFEIPWGQMMAASVLVTVPLIALALIFQRRILAGLTAGAVKG